MSTLENAPLQIIDGDRGANYPSQAEFSTSGHCLFLNAGNVTTTGFRFSDCAFITLEKDASLRKGKLVLNDVVLTTRGTVGNAAFFDESVPFEHIRINSGMVILRAEPSKLHPRYLYLFVRSALFHAQVSALRTGSAQPQLPVRDINRIQIPIPPLSEQQAIACILGALDDKIELNRRMNRTLEEMARAIFKSWFVDFDPVHWNSARRLANIPRSEPGKWFIYAIECEGGSHYIGFTDDLHRRFDEHCRGCGADWTKAHPPVRLAYWEPVDSQAEAVAREQKLKSGSGREWLKAEIARNWTPRRPLPAGRQVKPEIAALFPDSFEPSELGEMPKGWRVGTLGDVAVQARRGAKPEEIDPNTPYIALEHMPRRSIALSEWGTADGLESNKFEFKKDEILFGKLRPYFHKVGIAPVDGVCSTDIVVITPRRQGWFGFVLGHVASAEFVEYTNAGSTGTKMPRTSWTDMTRYQVVLPPEPMAAKFSKMTQPSVDRIVASIHESRTLAALRDTLLPKLISGELRVPDAERIAGRCL
ncbi:MAG TPA: restriction endonuclease subunit S [Verrucomicrobiota bacterium]|nr:restriction endonuclease subunit S [Verrucomicrobiota bacterium]HPC52493.1 restriction endonuclease subunit S [Verrucomicrobiota bacterium]HRR63994.1 restriction endonuclease subunit S [Candidatus Paceibacterota bacterium]HRV39923.1 restriction endonuclease subunit S [Candidatus Paceibacterota bacterium]